MRLLIILLSIVVLSIALGSMTVTLVAIGGATNTVSDSMDNAIDLGMDSVRGFVTLDIVPVDEAAGPP
jgi:hypothetical protein